MSADTSSPLAFSYIRFSTPEQRKGDSLRRQVEGTEEYCRKNGLRLDNSLSLRDLGVSGHKGRHRTNDKHALAQFLALAKKDRIPAGSFLIVENLDRLTREDERTALRLWMDILDMKINIVQLKPETVFRHEKSDMMDIMRAIIELSRGHSESARKVERNGAAWKEKRDRIGEKKLTGKCPFWLRLSDDKTEFHELPDKVELVRRLFHMARYHGSKSIAKILNDEKISSPYKKWDKDKEKRRVGEPKPRDWNNVSVLAVLRSRSVMGEFTPHQGEAGDREPAAPPVADYYPRIIEPDLFHATLASIERRKQQRGPRGKYVRNLFTELLKDARDGTPMHIIEKKKGDKRLVSSGAVKGSKGSKYVSFSYTVFEKAILAKLDEIDPREVLGIDKGPDRVSALEGKKTEIESTIAKLESELRKGDIAALARTLRQLEEESREVGKQLAEARQQAASPASVAWGETKSLLSALKIAESKGDEALEEARLRLRAAIHRIITEAAVLVVSKGRHRLCAVQLWFADGTSSRSYLMMNRVMRNAAPGERDQWKVASFADAMPDDKTDLRKRDSVKRLERTLEQIDVEALWEAMQQA